MRWKTLQKSLRTGTLALSLALSSKAGTPPGILLSTVSWDGAQASAKASTGETVRLGLDVELQQQMDILMEWAAPISGAATLIDADTGQVLAAVEVGPTPLLLEANAPAASVFKVVTTTALYEKTRVVPVTRVCTRGGLRQITREHLVPATGPGAVCGPFAHALGVSRNAAFAQLATTELLREDLLEVATALGFNQPLNADAAGTLGTLEVPYNDLAFARTATGFQNSRLSVFGGAQLALTIASGGVRKSMHFGAEGGADTEERRAMSIQTAGRLRKAMEVTIHSGTARDSFVDERGHSRLGPIQAAGKTGTLKPSKDSPTTSWFIGFAPSKNPEVVVSVALQNPDRWRRLGHQLARDLLAIYFKKRGVKGISTPL